MLERTEPPTDPQGELDGITTKKKKNNKKTHKTEKPSEMFKTEQEELDGSSPRKKPLNNLEE